MKLKRLRGRKEVERVLKRGKRLKGEHVNVVLLQDSKTPRPNLPDNGQAGGEAGRARFQDSKNVYAAVSVSKKLAKRAVDRNRMRRRCREALRILLKELIPPEAKPPSFAPSHFAKASRDKSELRTGRQEACGPACPAGRRRGLASPIQLLLLPRPSSLTCAFEELKKELRSLLSL